MYACGIGTIMGQIFLHHFGGGLPPPPPTVGCATVVTLAVITVISMLQIYHIY